MSESLPPKSDQAHDDDVHGHEHVHDHTCCSGHGPGHAHAHPHADTLMATAVPADDQEWTRRFLLFLEMAVLLLWAVLMVWFYASGRINSYLIGEGTFRIQVLVGGLILAVLGFFNWQMRAVPETCGHDHGDGEDCGHDHEHHDHHEHCDHDHGDVAHNSPDLHHAAHSHEGTPGGRGMALALLALSVTAAAAFTPDDFSDSYKRNMLSAYSSRPAGTASASGASAAQRLTPEGSPAAAGGMTLAVIEKYQPRNKAGNFDLDVMQLYYSGSDPEYAKVMKGQGVETVGQVVKDTANPGPGRWRVFVLQMTCCAADARPYSLPVQFADAAPALQEMGWYRLTGKIDYVEEKGVTTAVLKASAFEPTLRPKEQRTLF